MSKESISLPVFATPFYRVTTGATPILESIKPYLLERETADYRHPNSPQATHQRLFESRFDLLHWTDPQIRDLKELFYQHLLRYTMEVNKIDAESASRLSFRHESWYHIARKGAYFQPHTHPLAAASLVYCVDPGDDGLDDIESGALVFTDPRNNASMYLDPSNRHMERLYSFDNIRLNLKADELVIFPSYLQHYVEPYAGESPRITVAANFSFHL